MRPLNRKGLYPVLAALAFLSTPSQVLADGKVKILTSFLPVYHLTAAVAGERQGVEVDCLLPGEADPHDFEMRPSDMKKVQAADAVILNGLGMEGFLERVIGSGKSPGRVLESGKGLPVIAMEEEEDHGHHHDEGINPHVWVSPGMAAIQAENIAAFLSRIDPGGAWEYGKNAAELSGTLKALSAELKDIAASGGAKKAVTYHRAFDYLAREAGFEIAGVIYSAPGEEPSAGEIAALIAMMKREGVKVIFSEPGASGRLVDIVAKETGGSVYILDPLDTGRLDKGYYEAGMRQNIEALRKAFSK